MAPATCSPPDDSGLPGEATWERSRKCGAPLRSYGRQSIKGSQWGANSEGSNDDLHISSTQIPVTVEI